LPLLASDDAFGAQRLDDSAGRQRHGRELGGRFGQQGPLLRGPNGGDVVDQALQTPPRRGTRVEHDRQLLRPTGEGAQPLLEGGQEIGKGAHIGLHAGGDAVGQGQSRRLIDDESQAELAQIVPALLIVAALGQLSSGIGGGNVRVEISGVIGQRLHR
jgi:hypothetical protein